MSRDHAANVARLAGEPEPDNRLPDPTCLLDRGPSEPVAWLAEGLLVAAEPAVLGGEGGSYKTTTALSDRTRVRRRLSHLGIYRTQGPTPRPDGEQEDSLEILAGHADGLIAGMGWDRARVLGNMHLLALEGVSLHRFQWTLHLERWAEELGAGLRA